MGYYVEGAGYGTTRIRQGGQVAALEKFKRVMLDPDFMERHATGGSFRDGKRVAIWYSWTDTETLRNAVHIADVLEEFGFDFEITVDGDIVNLCYPQTKTGSEEVLLDVLSEFFDSGDTIEWGGEDGSRWRTTLGGERAVIHEGRVVYG